MCDIIVTPDFQQLTKSLGALLSQTVFLDSFQLKNDLPSSVHSQNYRAYIPDYTGKLF